MGAAVSGSGGSCAAGGPVVAGGHRPVLIDAIVAAAAPLEGHWIDATFGAGGYARALLEAGAARVTGIDRDPLAAEFAAALQAAWGERLAFAPGRFGELDRIAPGPADGVVMDLGVSSMQLDRGERGFSFLRDGPLDMRMEAEGPDAAELLARIGERELADILFQYGEERASRRIARALVAARAEAPVDSTARLAAIVEACLPRAKPGQSHPATRSFQAIRIAVNDEYGQLAAGLEAAERALAPGGWLAVVSFHSGEDRVVKRFLQLRSGQAAGGSRHAPARVQEPARFETVGRARPAGRDEVAANPRARSAKLRLARRTSVPAGPVDRTALGLPVLAVRG